MPVRLLRPGITTSRRFNSLDWDAQSFYIRLLTVVDDYGRYDADHRILKAYCFPLRDDVSLKAVANMCEQLQETRLIEFYSDDEGKPYLQLTKWKEHPRSEKSKFPDPVNICKQLQTVDCKCSPPTPSPSYSPPPTPTPSPARATPAESVCDSSNVYELKAKFKADTRFEWLQGELCKAYHRPRPVVAIGEEQRLVAEISRREDVQKEWREIEAYRPKVEARYFPQTILSLCGAWDKTLDRARNYREPVKPEAKKSLAERQLEKLNKQILAET